MHLLYHHPLGPLSVYLLLLSLFNITSTFYILCLTAASASLPLSPPSLVYPLVFFLLLFIRRLTDSCVGVSLDSLTCLSFLLLLPLLPVFSLTSPFIPSPSVTRLTRPLPLAGRMSSFTLTHPSYSRVYLPPFFRCCRSSRKACPSLFIRSRNK